MKLKLSEVILTVREVVFQLDQTFIEDSLMQSFTQNTLHLNSLWKQSCMSEFYSGI